MPAVRIWPWLFTLTSGFRREVEVYLSRSLMVSLALAIGELTLAQQMKMAERNAIVMGGNRMSLAHQGLCRLRKLLNLAINKDSQRPP